MRTKVAKETYDAVFERDEGRCVICKSQISLQLHHIHGRSRIKTNEMDNCVMLCYVCHRHVHSNMKANIPLLDEYVRRKKDGQG